ncbi:3-deoxy-7-phosphoheptulonate synthase class II [Legionella sp. W05-934-2]|jgi:3-deoxy-7-phosphoheptulonate synthase|uniref:3-deoxy-7-phosphoheptulonate synthase class II n=1 Tax=Legionella sp. W05-934-2 TaxID=1198649 RepID=UPI0034637B02
MKEWTPTSWQSKPYEQSASYPDEQQLDIVVNKLSQLPPLVTSGEVKRLKTEIAMAGKGKAFILQGGDCAEQFNECRSDIISNKLKILLQMSLVLLHGLRKPIIRVGRIAGQYAKPRSSDFETVDGVTLPSYRGDLVNSPEFTAEARRPNPKLLLQGYSCSAMTLNFIRSLLDGGFADLHDPHKWDLSFVNHSKQADRYFQIVKSITDSLEFLEAIDGLRSSNLHKVDFYTSHEALHLHYEQGLTRKLKDGRWYDLSTHLPWIGMRTAKMNGAHVEFIRGIDNPIGIKIGPSADPKEVVELVQYINPRNEEGRVLLISRMGNSKIKECLPPFIEAINQQKTPVTWSCDPMHGNTEQTEDGIKTRHFDKIQGELYKAVEIHRAHHSNLGGVHFELTGDNVTECIGGARGLSSSDLKHAYRTLVDPRLNYEQSLEMALGLSQAFHTRD